MQPHQGPNPAFKIGLPIVLEDYPDVEFDRLMNFCEEYNGVNKKVFKQAWDLMEKCGFPKSYINRYTKVLQKASENNKK